MRRRSLSTRPGRARTHGALDGAKGFTAPSAKMDVRPGGQYRALIRSGEGKDYWFRGEYREVIEASRLVFTSPGRKTASAARRPGDRHLCEENGKTRMTFSRRRSSRRKSATVMRAAGARPSTSSKPMSPRSKPSDPTCMQRQGDDNVEHESSTANNGPLPARSFSKRRKNSPDCATN